MQVPEPRVPQPRWVVHSGQQTDGDSEVQVHDVQAIGSPLHLDEEASLLIVDAQVSSLDHGLASVLVQLAQRDDVGA
jgi:hypothetical protein